MKQLPGGRSVDAGQKREPIPKAVNPGGAAQIGIAQTRGNSEPLYIGRGYKAPLASPATHHSGSQGKHK